MGSKPSDGRECMLGGASFHGGPQRQARALSEEVEFNLVVEGCIGSSQVNSWAGSLLRGGSAQRVRAWCPCGLDTPGLCLMMRLQGRHRENQDSCPGNVV